MKSTKNELESPTGLLKYNKFATVSLYLGVIGLIPIIGVLTSILGIICAIIGLKSQKHNLAKDGLWISIFALLVQVIAVVFIITRVF